MSLLTAMIASSVLSLPDAAAPSPNLLTDPTFAGNGAGWRTLGAPRYQVVEGQGRDGSACLRYRKPNEGTDPKENSHHDQEVAIQPNTVYVAGAWFRREGELRPVLRIAAMDWATVALAVSEPSDEWQEVRTLFHSGAAEQVRFQIFGGALSERRESAVGTSFCDDVYLREATETERAALRKAAIRIDPGTVVGHVNPLFFGVNALYMIEDDASRADGKIARYLRELPCRLLRFPGGELADNYHWQTHQLDNPKKWPFRDGPETMDTDEFMVWCREIGAEPIFVVNLESWFLRDDLDGGIREAVEWVRYCNKEKGYNVRYWEIGNETYLKGTLAPLTAKQYAESFARFAKAMKGVDPTIKVGAVGPLGSRTIAPIDRGAGGAAWWPTVVELAGEQLDIAVIHHYHNVATTWTSIDVGRSAKELREFLGQALPGREVLIALTEWNTWKDSKLRGMDNALVVAEMIASYLEGGVDLANFWPLRLKGKHFRAMLDFGTNEPLLPYHVLKLFASNIGSQLVESECSNVQVRTLASLSEDGKTLCLFVMNKTDWAEGVDLTGHAKGFGKDVRGVVLTGADEETDSGILVDLEASVTAGGLTCRVPAKSLAVLVLAHQGP